MLSTLSQRPGLTRLFMSAVVGRLAMGAIGLIAILRVREMTGSYAAGGLVVAGYAIAHAASAPVLGRLVDKRGQPNVIAPLALLHGGALIGFGALADGAGFVPALALMTLAGATQPPLGAAQRAIWDDALPDAGDRHKLYSFESAIFEIVYICGPLLIVGALGAWSLRAAAFACGLLTLVGALAFAATPLSRAWRPHPERAADPLGALRSAGIRTLIGAFVLFGLAMAGIEIAVAEFTAAEGARTAVGPMLAVWGVGSMIGGFFVGHRAAPADAPRRLMQTFFVMAAGTALLPLAPDIWTLFPLILLAGLAIAPGLGVAFRLLSEVAPVGMVTEAQTLAGTGMSVGFALGSGIGGKIVQTSGSGTAFVLAAGALVVAALIVGARRSWHLPAPEIALSPG